MRPKRGWSTTACSSMAARSRQPVPWRHPRGPSRRSAHRPCERGREGWRRRTCSTARGSGTRRHRRWVGSRPRPSRCRRPASPPVAGQVVVRPRPLDTPEPIRRALGVVLLGPHGGDRGAQHAMHLVIEDRCVPCRAPPIAQQHDWVAERVELPLALPGPRRHLRLVGLVALPVRRGVEGVGVRVEAHVPRHAADEAADELAADGRPRRTRGRAGPALPSRAATSPGCRRWRGRSFRPAAAEGWCRGSCEGSPRRWQRSPGVTRSGGP